MAQRSARALGPDVWRSDRDLSASLTSLVEHGADLTTLPWLDEWIALSQDVLRTWDLEWSSTRTCLDVAALRTMSPTKFGSGTAVPQPVSCLHAVASGT